MADPPSSFPRSPEPDALLRADVAVVGAGAAGLYAALCAAREGAHVVLVSRSPLAESASYWAQGGVAAALAPDDTPARHLADTLAAGRDLARPSAARVLCDEAPDRVRDLGELGVRFDADGHGDLALGLEGGHRARRVVHAGGSATGRRITRTLSALVAVDERIDVLEQATASALWSDGDRCAGLRVEREGGRSALVVARATVLATGGAAALWRRTSNPRGAIGAGLSLAGAAGAALADLELVQFHPTALAGGNGRDGFLITEALRGEGARLLNEGGERFVDELAPRDEVAAAIQAELDARPDAIVHLDLAGIEPTRFPNVAAALAEAGLDFGRDLVPVAPAAHYTMGGIATDLDGGSSLPGLFAVGECACTGLHGANRLASNSLAECLVFGRRAALAAMASPPPPAPDGPAPRPGPSPAPPAATRAALWDRAGIERDEAGLLGLLDDPFPLARLIGASALARAESRGAHRRRDRPDRDPALDGHHAVVRPDDGVSFAAWT